MSKIFFTLCWSFVLLTSGCLLGDPSAARIVSLAPSAHEGKSTVSLSTNDFEVQEALKIIDSVLTTNGLTRQPSPSTPYSDGSIVRYQGSTTRGCGVGLRDNKLEIVFVEFGRRSSTEPVKNICDALKRGLERRFGADNVWVRTAN